MFASAWRIVRFDLGTAIRTRRALVALILYVLAAIGTGAAAVAIEASVLEPLRPIVQTFEGAAQSPGVGREKIEEALAFFTGDREVAHEVLNMPLFVAGFFWVTLTFLPLLIALMSADLVSAEVRHKSARFLMLRCSRESFLFGKLMSHGLLILVASAVANVALLLFAMARLPEFDTGATLILMGRFWILTLCFAFCYLALAALVSSLIDSVPVALPVLVGILIGFAILSLSDRLAWAVPSHYKRGLWLPRIEIAGASVAAFLGFGVLFLGGAWYRLRRRDL